MTTNPQNKLTCEILDDVLDLKAVTVSGAPVQPEQTERKLGPKFEILDVDVKRLHDDHSDIQQEIAFVATFAIHLTEDGIDALRQVWSGAPKDLAPHDKLLVVGADAELRSDVVPIDEDSVVRWLKKHYTFKFLLDGELDTDDKLFSNVGCADPKADSPQRLPLPWLKKLDVGHLDEDYIDVDVQIDEIREAAQDPAVNQQPVQVESEPATPSELGYFAVKGEIKGEAGALAALDGTRFQIRSGNSTLSFVLDLNDKSRLTKVAGDGKRLGHRAGATTRR